MARSTKFSPGDTVDGNNLTYYEGDIAFPSSGVSGNPIIVKNIVMDGTVDYNGTNAYYYSAYIAGLTTDSSKSGLYSDGSNVISLSNPGFETYTGSLDSGTNNIFSYWTAITSGANYTEATATKHDGSAALKITYATTAAYMYNSVYVMPGNTVTITFWTRGDGTRAGRITPYDNTNFAVIPFHMDSTDYSGITSTGVTGTTYVQKTLTFTVPATCYAAGIRLYNPSAAGVAYYDDVTFVITNGWVATGTNNIYKKYADWAPSIMTEDGVMLTPAVYANETAVLAGLTAGHYSKVYDAAAKRVLYYRATDNAAPSTHDLRISRFHYDFFTTPHYSHSMFWLQNVDYVTLKDSTFRYWGGSSTMYGCYGLMVNNADYATLDGLTISDNSAGLALLGGSVGVVVDDTDVLDSTTTGVIMSGGGSYNISYSNFLRNGKGGFYIGSTIKYDQGDQDNFGIGGDEGGTYSLLIFDHDTFADGGNATGAKGSNLYMDSTTDFAVTDLRVLNSIFTGSYNYALYAKHAVAFNISGNIFSGNATGSHAVAASSVESGFTHGYIYNNVFVNNISTSITATLYVNNTNAGMDVRNNIFYNNCVGGCTADLRFYSGTYNMTEGHNLFYGYAGNKAIRINDGTPVTYGYDQLATWAAASGQGVGDINTDPLFVSSTNYRLRPSSPAINAGTDVGLTVDMDGWMIPYSTYPDIGAYEWRPAGSLHQGNF